MNGLLSLLLDASRLPGPASSDQTTKPDSVRDEACGTICQPSSYLVTHRKGTRAIPWPPPFVRGQTGATLGSPCSWISHSLPRVQPARPPANGFRAVSSLRKSGQKPSCL